MIIIPKRRGGFTSMGQYILDLKDNDSKEVLGIYNLPLAESVWDAMAQMRALVGERLYGRNKIHDPIEHIFLRPRDGEHLTRAQFNEMKAETLKRLGYENCPRIEWEDVLHGEVHQHMAVLRLDLDDNLIHPYLPRRQCKEVAEYFEVKFGLRPALEGSSKASYYAGKNEVTEIWNKTEGQSGQQTKQAFEQKGYTLTAGHRGQFILVCNKTGDPFNPARMPMLKGQGLMQAGVSERFKDIDIKTLPATDAFIKTLSLAPRLNKTSKDRVKPHAAASPLSAKGKKNPAPRSGGGGSGGGGGHAPRSAFPAKPSPHLWRKPFVDSETKSLGGAFKQMPNTKGWPSEAMMDWEQWGKKNPARFFAMWSQLAPDIFPPSNGPK
jgi:hypothetical protein